MQLGFQGLHLVAVQCPVDGLHIRAHQLGRSVVLQLRADRDGDRSVAAGFRAAHDFEHRPLTVQHEGGVGHRVGIGPQARLAGLQALEGGAHARAHPVQGDQGGGHQDPGGYQGQHVEPALGMKVGLQLQQHLLFELAGLAFKAQQAALHLQQVVGLQQGVERADRLQPARLVAQAEGGGTGRAFERARAWQAAEPALSIDQALRRGCHVLQQQRQLADIVGRLRAAAGAALLVQLLDGLQRLRGLALDEQQFLHGRDTAVERALSLRNPEDQQPLHEETEEHHRGDGDPKGP